MSNDVKSKILTGPVPGMSLAVSEKKAWAWENPPVYTKIDEVIKYHLTKLNDEQSIKSTIRLAQLGFPLMALTDAILTDAVSDGIHSIDSSEAARPAIFKHILSTIEESGVVYKTGLEPDNALENKEDRDVLEALIQKELNALEDDEPEDMDEGMDEDNLFFDALDYLTSGDIVEELNPGFSDDLNIFKDGDNFNPNDKKIIPNPDDPNNKEETAPPEEEGPFNPFPRGSDNNPIMAEAKPTKGLMNRGTV